MPVINGTNKAETLRGGVGADIIDGLGGADRLIGNQGSDRLHGGEGDDTLLGGSGSDELNGGDGDDLLLPGSNDDYDAIELSGGSDVIDFIGAGENSGYDIYGNQFDRLEVRISAKEGTVKKHVGNAVVETDRLVNIDKISSKGGYLYLSGTDGNDVITVSRATGPALILDGSLGQDTVTGDARTFERLNLRPSNPDFDDFETQFLGMNIVVTSSDARGQMNGVARSFFDKSNSVSFSNIDLVSGTFKNDVFKGGRGNDWFRPGEGNDGMDGGRGLDTVDYRLSRILETRIDLELGEASATYLNSNGRRVWSDGLRSVEGVVGSPNGRDLVFGSKAANRMDGLGGDDRLHGRRGDDTLIGGDGNDTLVGGIGRDVFVFDSDDGDDVIRDFANGQDRIRILDGATRFSDLVIGQVGRSVEIDVGDTTIVLRRTLLSDIDASDFLFG